MQRFVMPTVYWLKGITRSWLGSECGSHRGQPLMWQMVSICGPAARAGQLYMWASMCTLRPVTQGTFAGPAGAGVALTISGE